MTDYTEKIKKMNEERGWTLYRLAKNAQLSPSTLTNMMHRGTSPSLSTIEHLCQAYNISLNQFFYGEEDCVYLTSEQEQHLKIWDSLDEKQKRAVDMFMEGIHSVKEDE